MEEQLLVKSNENINIYFILHHGYVNSCAGGTLYDHPRGALWSDIHILTS